MGIKDLKILFIHNKAMWYRIPFFNRLSQLCYIKFIFTNENEVKGLKSEYKLLKRYGIYPFSIAIGLIPILIHEKYDVVVFPPADSPGELFDNILCYVLTKIKGKPYIVWSERWNCPQIKRPLYKKIYHFVDRRIMGYICGHAIANVTSGGTKQKEYFLSLGVPADKIYISPYLSNIPFKNWDFEEINNRKNEIVKTLRIENKKVILCVARLVKYKGIDYLLKAFAKLKKRMDDICLIIVGGEDYYGREKFYGNKLRNLCAKLGISNDVHFTGHVASEELPVYYLICNLLVYPSIGEKFCDTGCLPVSDAMYFGKPVISTNVVGFAYDLIKDGINGFMVPQKNVDALYKAMRTILSDSKLEKKMGKESLKMMEKFFTPEKMIEGFKKAIESAIK